MGARDLLLLARRTAGLTQAELAQRLARPRSTIARWELGEMQPAYDAVVHAIAACGLEATVALASADSSYLHDVGGRLRHFSKHPVRYKLWTWVSKLNVNHGRYAWYSLFSVALVDLYIYLLAINAFDDPRFF